MKALITYPDNKPHSLSVKSELKAVISLLDFASIDWEHRATNGKQPNGIEILLLPVNKNFYGFIELVRYIDQEGLWRI